MPYYYFYGYDFTYLLVLIAIIFSFWASTRVNRIFKKYSSQRPINGLTGYDAARRMLDHHGLHNVKIEQVSGNLSDHFDPKTNTIRLSDSVYGVSSTSAVGVAAHEAGHAVQYATDYAPLKLRNAIIPITNIGSRLSTPLIILGLLMSSYGSVYTSIAYVGIWCFALSVVFQLLTLPTEFNASRRAIICIESIGILSDEEIRSTKKVLWAAAMTYVAATTVAITQLLRLMSVINRNNRR